MCTVTFLPTADKVFISSNRDEKMGRPPALAPATYAMKTGRALFPRDAQAGGTWIALHERARAVVILNGAFLAHQHHPPYARSRGLVLLEIIDSLDPLMHFRRMDLENIEPFTVIMFGQGQLQEGRWDGQKKYGRSLKADEPQIWSSATLYSAEMAEKRKNWFETWRGAHGRPVQADILDFHLFSGEGDGRNDLVMNREGQVSTVSITSIEMTADRASMQYLDIAHHQSWQEELAFIHPLHPA